MLGPANLTELQALIINRNTPRKPVWRAVIVFATVEGHGIAQVMRRAGMSKPTVWRWRKRYLDVAIFDDLAQHNETPKPFRWAKSAADIFARDRCALDVLDEIRGNR